MHNEPMIKATRSVTILFYAYQLHSRHLQSKETVHSSMLVKQEAHRLRRSPSQQFPTLFEQVHSSPKTFPLSSRIDWLIDWLIDWIVFYAVSAIFQPYNGGGYSLKVISLEILKFLWRLSRAFSSSKSSETVFCVPRGVVILDIN